MILLRDMAPILSFTAEESYRYIPEALKGDAQTIFAARDLTQDTFILSDEVRQNWEQLLVIRSEITKAIEPLRKSGEIGHSLDTAIELYLKDSFMQALKACNTDLRAVCIVSQIHVHGIDKAPVDAYFAETNGIAVAVSKAKGEKCERCWIYSDELGTDPEHPTLCPRCTEVMKKLA